MLILVPAARRYAFFLADNPTGMGVFLNAAGECPQGLSSVWKSAGLVPLPLLHFSCIQPIVCELLVEGQSVLVRKQI